MNARPKVSLQNIDQSITLALLMPPLHGVHPGAIANWWLPLTPQFAFLTPGV